MLERHIGCSDARKSSSFQKISKTDHLSILCLTGYAYFKAIPKDGDDVWFDPDWPEHNSFMVLRSYETEELFGIRDYGRYSMDPSDYFMRTEFLPVFTHPGSETIDMSDASKVLDLYYEMVDELENAIEEETPLVIIKQLTTDNYLAWDFDAEREVIVKGFKTYRDSFTVIDTDSTQNLNPEKFYIYIPHDEFIRATGIALDPFALGHKLPTDPWESREIISISLNVLNEIKDENVKEIYIKGVAVANRAHTTNLGCDNAFFDLESRVDRLESLVKLDAPAEVVKKEAELINKAIHEIESKVKKKSPTRIKQ